MSVPFYVSPEQQMLDRAEFARKGISRGRSVVALKTADGIALVAENPSTTLHKVSELYDRLAFAAVGRYHEFEALRIAGIRHADLRGYSYDRTDVTARGLATSYSSWLGNCFASPVEKPYEVELIVAELGATPEEDLIFRISYDGTISDVDDYVVLGGNPAPAMALLAERYSSELSLEAGTALALDAIAAEASEEPKAELAWLDRREAKRRKFARVSLSDLPGRTA